MLVVTFWTDCGNQQKKKREEKNVRNTRRNNLNSFFFLSLSLLVLFNLPLSVTADASRGHSADKQHMVPCYGGSDLRRGELDGNSSPEQTFASSLCGVCCGMEFQPLALIFYQQAMKSKAAL